MKIIKSLLAMMLFGYGSVLSAQDMPRTVIGNAGDYYQNIQIGNLHWTVGEIAISRYQNGLELGEGFHQMYYDLLVDVVEPLPPGWEVSVYPNPATNWVRVQSPEDLSLHARLFTADGRQLLNLSELRGTNTLDFGQYPEGAYLLRLQDEEGRQRTVRLVKMSR